MKKCPKCKHDSMEPFAGDFETGVESNGYRETAYQEGYECWRCGLIVDGEDADNLEDPDEEPQRYASIEIEQYVKALENYEPVTEIEKKMVGRKVLNVKR